MKIVIISPPKSGATRLRCLLATLYNLRAIDARDAPTGSDPANVTTWLETLPSDSVTHTELPFDPVLVTSAADVGVTMIAIIRHPFDLFISNREVRNQRDQRANRRSRTRDGADSGNPQRQVVGTEYTFNSFKADLQILLDWSSGAAVSVRYEDICDHTEVVLSVLVGVLGKLDEAKIARAIMICPSEQRIVSSGNRGVRMTELPPGSWQTQLDEDTRVQLQGLFWQAIVSLGYEPSHSS